MSDFGIKTTISGKDISSTDIRDFLLHSEYTMLKYHSNTTGSVVIPISTAGIYTVDFSHSLGYVPFFLAYASHPVFESIERLLPFASNPSPLVETAWADSTKVRCRADGDGSNLSAITVTFRVIIFKDKII